MSWVRERVDIKDRWGGGGGGIKWKVGALSATGLTVGSCSELHY